MRFDIISDTHGFLSPELIKQLEGADYIVHAGDICSASDYRTLKAIAPLQMCLGNNDWAYDYGPEVKPKKVFYASDFMWHVCHYREKLDLSACDIAICGHTHKPFVLRDEATGTLVMNPGSPTYPRGCGASMGRIITEGETNNIVSAEIIQL